MDEGTVEITLTQTQQNINQFLSAFNVRKEGILIITMRCNERNIEWN